MYNFYDLGTDYGSSRTRSFSDIFPDYTTFETNWQQTQFSREVSLTSLPLLYELLLARYANSTIASSDENRFALELFSIIFRYAPTWQKRLEIQKNLREMQDEELLTGSALINNTSVNPSEDPTTNTLEELQTINQQTVSKQKRDKLKAYALLTELLDTDLTGTFLDRFKHLFRTIVAPQRPLFYEVEENL